MANVYRFKVNIKNTRKRCQICFKVNNKETGTTLLTNASIIDFEQVKIIWKILEKNQKIIPFCIKNLSSKCDQIWCFQGIWSHLLKKSLMENFIFCAVKYLLPLWYKSVSLRPISLVRNIKLTEIIDVFR